MIPPRTTVKVSWLLVPGCKIEIDLWGVKPGTKKQVITTRHHRPRVRITAKEC